MRQDTLYARMFGDFALEWNGTKISGGGKTSESQFAYLMQMILHSGSNGVSKKVLEEVLFEGRDLNNIHHSLRSVIYNAKKKLRSAGLPEENYFEQHGGRYYWTASIPVLEDAREMERLYGAAETERDLDLRQRLYVEAAYLYTGEFLSAQSGVAWVAQESKRYHDLFCLCMEKAVQLMRVEQSYLQMEELGLYAAKIDPLADWETVTMEALVSLGREQEARRLYSDTVEFYLQQQGLRPSQMLLEMMNRLGAQIEHRYAVLDEIQDRLQLDDGQRRGGYLCSYPVFQGIYQMVCRMMRRGGQSAYLMLCTVVDSKGNPMKDGVLLDELSQRLGDAIRNSVRQSDAINRYGKGQYLLLLVNATRENCGIVQKRINQNFLVGRQRTGIQYYVNSVVCTPEKERILMEGG